MSAIPSSKEEGSSSSSLKDKAKRRIPHRPYGANGKNASLPRTAAMVGLGCSSFSGFFDTSANKGEYSLPAWLHGTRTADVATIDDPQHPLIRQWVATIHYAILDAGITLLDTAPWYGHGLSEQVVGMALQELFASNTAMVTRQDIILNTKVGRYEADPVAQFDFSRDFTMASVRRSLQRLQTPYIDVLQLHDPEFSPSLDVLLQETIPALLECRDKGYCRALGLTGYPLPVQRQIFQATLEHFDPEPQVWDQALTYGHYNLHDQTLLRQPANLRQGDDSYWQYCRQRTCICLAAAPLSMGLFTPCVPDWHPAPPELREACQQATTIAQQHDVNITELALLVALAETRIPVTILGMKYVAQVQTVQRLCHRLQEANFLLSAVLVDKERKVWSILADPVEGPFAQVWKTNQYQWDGVAEARSFWKSLPEHKVLEWQATS